MKLSGMRGPGSPGWSLRVAVVVVAWARAWRLGRAAVAAEARRKRRRSMKRVGKSGEISWMQGYECLLRSCKRMARVEGRMVVVIRVLRLRPSRMG